MGFKRRAPIDVPLLLERLDIKAKRVSKTKWEGSCPHPEHASNPHAWFIRDDPDSDFHATHCCKSHPGGFQGGAIGLVATLLNLEEEDAREWLDHLRSPKPLPSHLEVEVLNPPKTIVLPPAVRIAPFAEWPTEALHYLLDRKVALEQVIRWGVGFVPTDSPDRLRGRIVFPAVDQYGRLMSYTARAWRPKAHVRYLEPHKDEGANPSAVYGEAFWRPHHETVVVTEGIFDALGVERVVEGVAVAGIAGSRPHVSQLLKLTRFKTVVIATDGDGAGKNAWELARQQLGSHVRLVRACPPNGRDLAAMTEEERRAFLEPALRGIG